MIRQFSVSNFKSIRNKMTLSFVPNGKVKNEHDGHLKVTINEKNQLLKLGVLYGYNASGKSNIIEAVQTLRNIVTHGSRVKERIPFYHPFEFDDESRNNPTEFALDFFVDDIRFLYTISYNSNTIVEESLFYWPETSRRKIFERHYNNALDTSDISFGTDCDLNNADKLLLKANTINNNSLMFAYQMTNISSKILDCVSSFFRESFLNTVTPQKDLSLYGVNNLYENIKEGSFYSKLMEKADFQITNLEIVDTNTSGKGIFVDKSVQPAKAVDMEFNHRTENGDYKLSFLNESNGTHRYFGLIAILKNLIEKKQVLFIDELDNSLHPDLVSFFLTMFLFNSNGSQLFVSTHDYSLLEKDFMRPDMIWFCEKNKDGSSEYYQALDCGIHKNNNLLRCYQAGKFGAIPDLGSPVINMGEGRVE